jgi:hypothetical protein
MTKLFNKFILVTDSNREAIIQYCEDKGILTCAQRTVRSMLDNNPTVVVVGFDEEGAVVYSSRGWEGFRDKGYEEVTIPVLQPSVTETVFINCTVKNYTETSPCKRELIIKLEDLYRKRDSLDLEIEKMEGVLKEVL